MSIPFITFIFFISSTSLLNSMEQSRPSLEKFGKHDSKLSLSKQFRSRSDETIIPTKQSKKTKKRPKSQSVDSADLPFIPRKNTLNTIQELPEKKEPILIIAARKCNCDTIKIYLTNPYLDPNIQDDSGNSPLHIAAELKHLKCITILLNDPRVDASKRNHNNKAACSLIKIVTEEDRALRHQLFARCELNFTTEDEGKKIIEVYTSGTITERVVVETAQKIKNRILASQKAQQLDGRELPDSALLPAYANDTFIMNMLFFYLANQK